MFVYRPLNGSALVVEFQFPVGHFSWPAKIRNTSSPGAGRHFSKFSISIRAELQVSEKEKQATQFP